MVTFFQQIIIYTGFYGKTKSARMCSLMWQNSETESVLKIVKWHPILQSITWDKY